MKYPAITLWQPWATLIALGLKTIETRTHARFAKLAGQRIAIHAGLRNDRLGLSQVRELWTDGQMERWRDYTEDCVAEGRPITPRGVVVAMATVKKHRQLTATDSHAALVDCECTRRWGLVLEDVEQVGQHLARGRQGIWTWEAP